MPARVYAYLSDETKLSECVKKFALHVSECWVHCDASNEHHIDRFRKLANRLSKVLMASNAVEAMTGVKLLVKAVMECSLIDNDTRGCLINLALEIAEMMSKKDFNVGRIFPSFIAGGV